MGRREFSEEFKREAVALVLEQGYTVARAAKSLGIGESALRRWIGNRRSTAQAPASALERGNADQRRIRELEKRVIELERERDILKNIFKGAAPSRRAETVSGRLH
ncbi:MAG: Mobile element protein [uncultured Caballeronia sp.]|nr:MAG: Mobile element protein [uncultured Caballeronia sp.]